MSLKSKIRKILYKYKLLEGADRTTVTALYSLSEKSLIAAMAFSIVLTIFLYSKLTYAIVLWGSVMLVLLSFRRYSAYLFKTTSATHTLKTWYRNFLIYSFLTAIMASSLGFVFMPYLNDFYQLLVIACLLAYIASASASLSSDIRIAIGHVSIVILPLILTVGTNKFSSEMLAAGMVPLVLFYIAQNVMILKNNRQEKEIKELAAEKDLLKNLFSEAPLGMLSYDSSLDITDANKHLHKIFERENKPIVGKNLNSLPNSTLLKVFKDSLTQGAQLYKGPFFDRMGHYYQVEIKAFPFNHGSNDFQGGIAIIEDKTKEHRAQNKINSLNIELERQVEKNQLLLEENKQFIADMVHQIRTPLSVIMAYTSLVELENDSVDPSYLAQINSAISMLSNSYEDLSYIISNDTISYNPIEINFTEFIKERVDFFEGIAQANGKSICANITGDTMVYMNDTELERLIDNNISNAIKHSSDKSEIEVVLEKSNSEIILKFISKGAPIPDASKIFEKNHTDDKSAKRSLGLGLSMVKNICEKNSINYSVHSEKYTNIFTYVFKV